MLCDCCCLLFGCVFVIYVFVSVCLFPSCFLVCFSRLCLWLCLSIVDYVCVLVVGVVFGLLWYRSVFTLWLCCLLLWFVVFVCCCCCFGMFCACFVVAVFVHCLLL